MHLNMRVMCISSGAFGWLWEKLSGHQCAHFHLLCICHSIKAVIKICTVGNKLILLKPKKLAGSQAVQARQLVASYLSLVSKVRPALISAYFMWHIVLYQDALVYSFFFSICFYMEIMLIAWFSPNIIVWCRICHKIPYNWNKILMHHDGMQHHSWKMHRYVWDSPKWQPFSAATVVQ